MVQLLPPPSSVMPPPPPVTAPKRKFLIQDDTTSKRGKLTASDAKSPKEQLQFPGQYLVRAVNPGPGPQHHNSSSPVLCHPNSCSYRLGSRPHHTGHLIFKRSTQTLPTRVVKEFYQDLDRTHWFSLLSLSRSAHQQDTNELKHNAHYVHPDHNNKSLLPSGASHSGLTRPRPSSPPSARPTAPTDDIAKGLFRGPFVPRFHELIAHAFATSLGRPRICAVPGGQYPDPVQYPSSWCSQGRALEDRVRCGTGTDHAVKRRLGRLLILKIFNAVMGYQPRRRQLGEQDSETSIRSILVVHHRRLRIPSSQECRRRHQSAARETTRFSPSTGMYFSPVIERYLTTHFATSKIAVIPTMILVERIHRKYSSLFESVVDLYLAPHDFNPLRILSESPSLQVQNFSLSLKTQLGCSLANRRSTTDRLRLNDLRSALMDRISVSGGWGKRPKRQRSAPKPLQAAGGFQAFSTFGDAINAVSAA
ncbi:hypothetical protein B0H16DRAFT_1687971 [Mycena metata]|uniref:Uncharacterized protein n=1 Tax=Mycena metata TaxID=1033252 RepID=A0AAD7JFV4_9AGAR|nr:hypothetical protein B0H16DRAFT_1687971 [Mycena metata]